MPTNLHNPRQSSRERYYARQSVRRLAKAKKRVEVLTAPWLGWVPDLPAHMVGWKGFRDGAGLIPKTIRGQGLFLTTDDGTVRVDGDRMTYGGATILTAADALMVGPLALTWGGLTPGDGVVGAVTMLTQFTDANGLPQRIAIISGDEGGGAGTDCLVANLNPATDVWREINADAVITAIPDFPQGDREALWDSAAMGFGAPARTDAAGANAFITEPCIVFCNSDENGPVDPVCVFPNDAGIGAPGLYDWLQPDNVTPVLPAHPFLATSVEAFGGRLHFLGTLEAAVEGERRHRWTAIGTASPDESIVGSGYLDFDADFDRRGLRIESMENHLVLYFEDGVAFQIPTGRYADAYRPRIISTSRGLLGTHAMCKISPHLHFGIFNDGWYTLNSSGKWSKAGKIVIPETEGKAHEMSKWEDTFYQDLNYDFKHRIVCTYDKFRQIVKIAYTGGGDNDNSKILNYHWPTDSCWPDRTVNPVTMWGMYDVQAEPGELWNELDPLRWSTIIGSWISMAPQFVDETVVRGCLDGMVLANDFDTVTQDGVVPTYSYQTHEISRNESPWLDQTFHRLGVEYMSTTGLGVTATVFINNLGVTQTHVMGLDDSTIPGQMHTAYAPYRLRNTHHGFWLTGSAPVLIRSMMTEVQLHGSLDREGQG